MVGQTVQSKFLVPLDKGGRNQLADFKSKFLVPFDKGGRNQLADFRGIFCNPETFFNLFKGGKFMTKIIKKPLSILLAALMIVSLFAAVPMTVNAAPPGSGSGTGPGGTGTVIDPVHVSAGFTTQPYAIEGLVANGSEQALISAGTTADGATAYYYMTTEDITGEQANSLFNSPSKPGSFSTSIPKGTDAWTYYVWYAIDGGSNYEDLLPYMEINNTHITNKLTVTIAAPTYTVTWKNGDTVLETDTDVAEGATPTYDGATPTKAEDEKYTYTFAGWSPEITAVTGDVTYTAQYTATFKGITSDDLYEGLVLDEGTALKFMLMKSGERWKNGYLQVYLDDVLVKDLTVEGGPTTEPDRYYTTTKKCIVDSYEKYSNAHFIHFKSVYDVAWKNDDGSVLEKDENVVVGTTPTYDGTDPTKAEDEKYTYTFAGWTPEITAVTGDVTYTAQYTATFKGITSDDLYVGLVIDAGTPIKFMIIKSGEDWRRVDLSVYLDGTLVKDLYTQYVSKTEPDRYYTTTKKCIVDSYEFSRGDPSRHVLYLKSVYDVTWKNDGTELEKDENVVVGTTPTYDGTTPTKAEDENNTYTFSGWTPEVTAVTADAEYTATFTAVPKYDYITNGDVGYKFLDAVAKGVDDALADKNNYTSLCNFKLLGVQKKVESDELDSESKTDVRFVSVVKTDILRDADEYGYVFAKVDNKEFARNNAYRMTVDAENVLVKKCTESSNTISGDYGKYDANTDYKYVTASVNGIGNDTVAARFYIKKGDKYYYADYTNKDNETYTVCATAFSDLG